MTDTYRDLIAEIHEFTRAPMPRDGSPPRRSSLALLMDANVALRALSEPGLRDFPNYLSRQTETKLARVEYNAASIKVELQLMRERCAELMSQHQPLAGLDVDREVIRQVLNYVQCGRLK